MVDQKRRFPVLLIGVLALVGPTAKAPAQTIVVAAKSLNDLADDLEYVIKTVAPAGDPTAQMLLDNLGKFKAGDLLKGVDRGRGFGLAVTLPPEFPQGGPPSVVAAVPVSKFDELMESLKGLGLEVDDKPGAEGFSHKVSAPDGNFGLFALESKGYALFSLLPEGADKLRNLDPTSWWKKSRPGTAASVRVQLGEIPEALKEQVLNQLQGQAAQQRDRKPGENDAQYKGRVAGQDLATDAFERLIKDGDALALELGLDRQTTEVSLDLALTARPNTPMAKSFGSLKGHRSRFEGLGRDAAIAFWADLPLAKELRDVLASGFDQGFKESLKQVKSDEQKKLLERFGELMKSNLDAPEVDLGVAVRPSVPAGPDGARFVILAGMKVKDSKEFDRLFRDAVNQIKPEESFKVQLDVAKAADGTAIHQITGPFDEKDARIAKQFGKASLSVSFRADTVLIAFGQDGTDVLRKLDASATAPAARSDGLAALSLRMAALGMLPDKDQEKLRRAVDEVFKGQTVKHDRIFLAVTGEGEGLHLRVAVDLLAFKVAAIMGSNEGAN